MNSENKIIDYLSGELTEDQIKAFEEELSQDQDLANTFEQYKLLYETIETDPLEQPGISLADNFHAYILEEEKQIKGSSNKIRRIGLKITALAAAILLLISAGVFIGIQYTQGNLIEEQSTEIAALRSDIERMVSDQSVPTRINAMYVAQDNEEADPSIVNILIETLKEDESSHVRLAAVQALSTFESNKSVREVLIEQLNIDNDPFVKVAIIQTLSRMKESNAVHTFDNLINNEETPRFIKDEALRAKLELNKI